MHVNLSFRRRDGSNAFHDPDDPQGLSDAGKAVDRRPARASPGHRGDLRADRERIQATQAGHAQRLLANWGFDDRTVGVRVPPARGEGSRIEHRMADAAANPYLVGCSLAPRRPARDGRSSWSSVPQQVPGGDPNTEVAVANNLEKALAELQADTKLVDAMGEWPVESFVALKQAEWDRYVAAGATSDTEVTPWETDYYLPFF